MPSVRHLLLLVLAGHSASGRMAEGAETAACRHFYWHSFLVVMWHTGGRTSWHRLDCNTLATQQSRNQLQPCQAAGCGQVMWCAPGTSSWVLEALLSSCTSMIWQAVQSSSLRGAKQS